MNSEARNEFDVKYEGRVQKIREAAAGAIKQLDQLRSAKIAPEAFDAQVARIAQQTLHRYACDLIVHRTADGATRFLIKDLNTGRRYDLIKSFFIVMMD
jgi:thiamine monophosphate synthase